MVDNEFQKYTIFLKNLYRGISKTVKNIPIIK